MEIPIDWVWNQQVPLGWFLLVIGWKQMYRFGVKVRKADAGGETAD